MKRYLIIGLMIILGSNAVVLSRVALNRTGEITSQLTLTERELSLPRSYGLEKENSGITLSINWRTPSEGQSSGYNAKSVELSKEGLFSLGFENFDRKSSHWSEAVEMYWALEFDGDLYKAELAKAAVEHKNALLAKKDDLNDETKRLEKRAKTNLAKERKTRTRLIFIEASASYNALTAKFSTKSNILIVKGLAKAYFNSQSDSYQLHLDALSAPNVMVPLEYTDTFSGLKRRDWKDIKAPRYALNIQWGESLEPWVTSIKQLTP